MAGSSYGWLELWWWEKKKRDDLRRMSMFLMRFWRLSVWFFSEGFKAHWKCLAEGTLECLAEGTLEVFG